jgi:hypothetical protein
MSALAVQLPASPGLYWRFIPPKCGSKLYLHRLQIIPTDDGRAVMQKLQGEYDRIKSLPPYRFGNRAWIFWNTVLKIATLSEVCLSKPPISINLSAPYLKFRTYLSLFKS